MKHGLLCWLLLCSLFSMAQEEPKLMIFSGYIFSTDSVPAENAHLINYRDTKIVATDSTGHFTIFVQEGDSLMINHISLQAQVVHANPNKAQTNKFYIDYRTYIIEPVATRTYTRDFHNFEKNIQRLNKELQQQGFNKIQITRGNDSNPYDPEQQNLGLTTNLGDILGLFKKKKK